jgi:hypothetical protein
MELKTKIPDGRVPKTQILDGRLFLFFLMTKFELSSFFENFLIIRFLSLSFMIVGFEIRMLDDSVLHFLSF